MADVTYPLFPIAAFLGFVLALIPLPWHLQAWNSGTCFFMIWTSLACFNQFVNSIVWASNVLNSAPWWCEISIRIILGSSVGIPASSLCIVRRLYKISSAQAVSVSPSEKRRLLLIDSLICVLFPLLYIALQYVVQGHRFNIFEDVGCYPALYNTGLAYFISYMWPVLIGLISAVYCGLALWEFNKRRIQFSQFLKSNSSLTLSRYFRLMALAMTEMISTTPLAVFVIYLNATSVPIGPWISWDDTHFGYSRIDQVPSLIWRSNGRIAVAMELTRWLAPLCALVFFSFFGFAQEAQKQYRAVYLYLKKSTTSRKTTSKKHQVTLEVEINKTHDDLPRYTTSSKALEMTPYSSSPSDCESMTDVSSKYEMKSPYTPSPTLHSSTINSKSVTPSHTPIFVSIPPDVDMRRFTM